MADRLLGPYRGYYIAATTLLMGDKGDEYLGWGKVFASRPTSTYDSGEIRSVSGESTYPTAEDALDAVEDRLVEVIDSLPEKPSTLRRHEDEVFALAYASKTRGRLQDDDLRQLLHRARQRNEVYDVTGMLVYADGVFMQYLEGPEPCVNLIYRSIRRDPMHQGLIKLFEKTATKRLFSGWRMAFDAAGAELWMPDEARPSLATTMGGEAVQALLGGFLGKRV